MSRIDNGGLRRCGILAATGLVIAASMSTGIVPDGVGASPPGQSRRGVGGTDAVQALGTRLPAVAASHGWSEAQTRRTLLSDATLRYDGGHGLYFEEPATSNTGSGTTVSLASVAMPFAPEQTFQLHSNPGASKVLLLDLDGHTTTGTPWNSTYGSSIVSAPYDIDGVPASFSDQELANIQHIWARVADDYAPLDVDVTTQDPGAAALTKTSSGDQLYGVRVVISPTNWYNGSAGGVAYVGSFNWSTDTPAFVFTLGLGNGAEKYTAEAAAHEAGHSLGLSHDGTSSTGYYAGHGSWAPIMGVGYYESVTQWSRGEYAGATNTQDDLTVMTNYGPTTRVDDVGDTLATATPLTAAGSSVTGAGRIERATDRDVFSLATAGGAISLTVTPAALREPDLDLRARLLDSAGAVVATADPAGVAAATISTTVAGGTYLLEIDGVGHLDPATTGYSDYASLGTYRVSGTMTPTAGQAPVIVASATPTTGTGPLVVTLSSAGSYDPDGGALSYSWTFGDGTAGSTEANPTHTYQQPGTYTAVLTATDPSGASGTQSVTITVTAPAVEARVATVRQLTLSKTNTRTATAVVVVTDASGTPVANATVDGAWGGVVKGGASGVTDASGRVSLTRSAKRSGTATFAVTSVRPLAPDTWDGITKTASIAI